MSAKPRMSAGAKRMRNPFKANTRAAFFWRSAGWSYDPSKETPEEGRKRGALALAQAEGDAEARGLTFQWEVDDIDSSDFSDERPTWALWVCVCRGDGENLASLAGVDFGRGREPWGQDYREVVEAELAIEALEVLAARRSEAQALAADVTTVREILSASVPETGDNRLVQTFERILERLGYEGEGEE